MKTGVLITLILLVAGLVVFMGCDAFAPADHDHDETADCMDCHSGSTPTGNAILVAKAQYENSGHYLGPRVGPDVDADHLYVHHGSNAMYAGGAAYGSDCSQCHSHQGFIAEFVSNGDAAIAGAGGDSQIGCFTCHAPHETGDFGLRIETAVLLADGTTSFDIGAGNLCVNCHQARRTASSYIVADTDLTDGDDIPIQVDDGTAADGSDDTFLVDLSSHAGTHHGPMGDMIMGVNAGGDDDYTGVLGADNPHAANVDGCVSCHLVQWGDTTRASMSLGVGGHAFYLQGDVHGEVTDVLESCESCHDGTTAFEVDGFDSAGQVAEADWDGNGTAEDVLVEIQGLRDTLLAYFGTGSNFYVEGTVLNTNTDDSDATTTDDAEDLFFVAGAAGDGPVNDGADTPGDVSSGVWMVDWDFDGAAMTEAQGASFWSFKYFIEDKSGGIHNPRFAAQMLFDAATDLGLTVGTRPVDY